MILNAIKSSAGIADGGVPISESFTLSPQHELPFGHGKSFGASWSYFVNSIGGGWQWHNIVTIGTGTPFDVFMNGSPTRLCGECAERRMAGD
jgi:hypothetical protein